MLNSTEQEISTAHKKENAEKYRLFLLSNCQMFFIMLIHIKMSTTVGILTFMSMMKLMLRGVEQEKRVTYILTSTKNASLIIIDI